MDLEELIRLGECEFIDFKEKYSPENSDLIHDILCLANARTDTNTERYLVFGVRDSDLGVVGIQGDENRKNAAQIIDLFRNAGINHIPNIEVEEIDWGEVVVDILTISDKPEKPYFLIRDYRNGSKTVRAGVVYERNGSTNTPIDKCAAERNIEWMFKQRIGLDLTPRERATKYLRDIDNWKYSYNGESRLCFYYEQFPEFVIEKSLGDSDEFEEPWHLKFPDQRAYRDEFLLKVSGTIISSLLVIWCDGSRVAIVQPKQKMVGENQEENGYPRSYYYIEDSLEYLFQEMINEVYPQDFRFHIHEVISVFKSQSEASSEIEKGYSVNPPTYYYFRGVTSGYEVISPSGRRYTVRSRFH